MATHWLKYNSPSKPVPRPFDPSPIRTYAPKEEEAEEPRNKLRSLLIAEGLGNTFSAMIAYGVASVEDFTLLADVDICDIQERHGMSNEEAKSIDSLRTQLATPANLEMARLKVGLRPIIQRMKDQAENAETQQYGCMEILELIPNSADADWRRIKTEDGVKKQAQLRYSIAACSLHHPGASNDRDGNRALLAVPECGAVNVLCAAAEGHRQNLEIQLTVCKLLYILGRAPENLLRIAHQGGIEAVIGAIQAGVAEPPLQVAGCNVLARLGLDAECYTLIPRKGGVVAVIGSMRVHRSDAAVQEVGCLALHNLTWREGEVDNKCMVVETGGVEAIIAAMKVHAQHIGVQKEAVASLCSLAGSQGGGLKAGLGQRGAIEAVVAAMKLHIVEVKVQEQACMALHNLSNNSELGQNLARMRGSGAVEAISTALANFSDSERVQKWGRRVLARL